MGLAQQFDLLYAFCQRELTRRQPGQRWLTLYRGTHDAEEYIVRPSDPGGKTPCPKKEAPPGTPTGAPTVVEFNNLSSFTSDPEIAWEFGSAVWAVRVPLAKVLCFSGLLPAEFLQGEAEHIVIGGNYCVQLCRG